MPPDTAPTVGSTSRRPWPFRFWQSVPAAPVGDTTASLRIALYTAALAIAYGLYLAVIGPGQPLAFWAVATVAGLAMLLGFPAGNGLFRFGVVATLALASAIPVLPALAAGMPLGDMLKTFPLWPQTLVALFASRVLGEDCDARFARLWRAPIGTSGPVQIQSVAAAIAMGVFLTLLFYQVVGWLAPTRPTDTSFSAIVVAALTGETIIHRAIVFLFFVIAGYLIDAVVHHRRDRVAFVALQRRLAELAARGQRVDGAHLQVLLSTSLGDITHVRATRLIEEAYDRVEPRRSAARVLRSAAFGAFQLGSRRFVRGLLPFLPMLGFFGTVVGLASAMAALPTSTPEGGVVDISGSLSGLAVKFQTTLLGIMASLIASGALAFLDKSEAELGAECAVLVAQVEEASEGA